MFDYHVHSEWSFDAKDSIESIAAEAAGAGIQEICFTEHIEPYNTYGLDWNGYINFETYAAETDRVRSLFPGLSIRRGLELGLSESVLPDIRRYLSGKSLDFIIASQHFIQNYDPYFPEYFIGKTKKEAEETYLKCLFNCLKGFDAFCVVGHIGYVSKNAPYRSPLEYADYPDLIDEILKVIIHAGHGIEINTSSWGVYGVPMPTPAIIGRFLELGGDVVTVGSDTHGKARVGDHSKEALELLRSVGGKYICTFENLKPVFHKF
jgi:histidinol-phosphatase (PHP family)